MANVCPELLANLRIEKIPHGACDTPMTCPRSAVSNNDFSRRGRDLRQVVLAVSVDRSRSSCTLAPVTSIKLLLVREDKKEEREENWKTE